MALAEKANDASMAGDFTAAEELLQQAIGLEPGNPVLVALLAALWRANGDPRESEAWAYLTVMAPTLADGAQSVLARADRWLGGVEFGPPDAAELVWVPGFLLKKDSTPKRRLRRRLEAAVRVAARFEDAPVLLSGGLLPGRTRKEAAVMAEYMVAHGVEQSRLLLEARSRESLENVLFARPFLDGRPAVCIVSEEPHLSRMCALVALTGWASSVVGVAAAPGQVTPADKAATYRDCLRLWICL